MRIHINDQIGTYIEYLRMLSIDTDVDSNVLWREICYNQDPDMYDHIFELYENIGASIDLANDPINKYGLDFLEIKLSSATERIKNSVSRTINELELQSNFSSKIELNLVVGNTSTNAIVTGFRSCSLFIFAERLPEGPYIDILIAHELGHVVHSKKFGNTIVEPTLLDKMFCEGVAIMISKIICPGLKNTDYINFSDKYNMNQRKTYIVSNFDSIRRDVSSCCNQICMSYMSSNNGNVSRIGYDIGYYFVEYLTKTMSIDEILNLNSAEVRIIFEQCGEKVLKSIS